MLKRVMSAMALFMGVFVTHNWEVALDSLLLFFAVPLIAVTFFYLALKDIDFK